MRPHRSPLVLEEIPGLAVERAGERFERHNVDTIDRLLREETTRDGIGEARADRELVRVGPSPPLHQRPNLPSNGHGCTVASDGPVDKVWMDAYICVRIPNSEGIRS